MHGITLSRASIQSQFLTRVPIGTHFMIGVKVGITHPMQYITHRRQRATAVQTVCIRGQQTMRSSRASIILAPLLTVVAFHTVGAFVNPQFPSQVSKLPPKVPSKTPIEIRSQGLFPSRVRHDGRAKSVAPRHLGLQEPVEQIVASLFCSSGGVPLEQAFAINALLFGSLIKVVSKMLTGPGIINGVILCTSLWSPLDCKG